MQDIVFLPKGRSYEPFTTSNVIAEGALIQHHTVTRLIQKHEADFREFGILRFKVEVIKGRGQPEKSYHLNEPQATLLLTYLKNTEPVRRFKKELVRQFYAMREYIQELNSPTWKETRSIGKEVRKKETDCIREFVVYAEAQGSQNAQRYYTSFTRLADKTAGISDRDTASVIQLNTLLLVENLIAQEIQSGIQRAEPYRDIYTACRARLGSFAQLVGTSPAQSKDALPIR